ncbi:MAG: type II toxin-antitoxin system HicB family antitoxin [Defluviitaleaceae bacterium]|nr:type II toxin-antitoxin system HicB family antitoxin [Defluviitaleaceae bacterium]MCL2170421.1 type II toxin-antitoxin system HicB family antitoxin [Defluviitaleaceae bacterium]
MRKVTYYAVFEPSINGGFAVYFPDLMGCTSYGKTFLEAEKMAKEALGYHLYEMEKDDDNIPSPSLPQDLEIFPETSEGYVLTAVSVYPEFVKNQLDTRAVRTNVTIPSWLKEAAEKENINFSQLLQTSLKEQLGIN